MGDSTQPGRLSRPSAAELFAEQARAEARWRDALFRLRGYLEQCDDVGKALRALIDIRTSSWRMPAEVLDVLPSAIMARVARRALDRIEELEDKVAELEDEAKSWGGPS